jgi:glycosyltransferase involved in cell wall biosynthesis
VGGFCFDEPKAEPFVETVLKLVDDINLRKNISDNAKRTINETLNIERLTKDMKELYKSYVSSQ